MSDVRGADGELLGRLTYTSFDGVGSGGWQVKEQLGVSDAEATALRARVMTQLDPGFELPRFPSPDEVTGLPRRLVYAPLGEAVGWWHTAPAGNDASGRPGNVFAQMLLDRSPLDPDSSVRPIDLWRSPDWLTPYGADAVREAELPAEPTVGPGSSVSAAAVVTFLLDLDYFRFGILGALLDATAEALSGGRRVVLATESVDTAALWIGAVAHLMPTQWAQRCFFSTLERAGTVAAVLDQGVHLACVPRVDLAALRSQPGVREALVVLDEAEDIDIGDLGSDGQEGRPHRSAGGFDVKTTEWSAMAQVALFDEATAIAALEALDAAVLGLADTGAEPGWGLALVVSHDQQRFVDARREAALVIARSSPVGDSRASGLMTGARSLISDQLGTTTEQAWLLLCRLSATDAPAAEMMRIALGIYAARALADLDWLVRDGGVPMTEGITVLTDELGGLAETAQRTLDAILAPAYGGDRCVGVAALTNLCARLGLIGQPLAENLRNALARTLTRELFEPWAGELVRRLGAFAEVTQAVFLRDQVESALGSRTGLPGSRLDPQVVFWLHPSREEPVVLSGQAMDDMRLRAELAVHLARWNGQEFATERPLAVWATLAELEDGQAPTVTLEQFFASPPWSPAEALTIERRFPGRLPLRLLAETLKTAPQDATLAKLSGALTSRGLPLTYEPFDTDVRFLAALRLEEHRPWSEAIGTPFDQALGHVIVGGAYGIALTSAPYAASTVSELRVAAVIAAVLGRHLIELSAVRAMLGSGLTLTTDEVRKIESGLGSNVDEGQVAYAAMMAAPRFPPREQLGSDPRFTWLEGCLVVEGGDETPVLVHHLRHRFEQFAIYADTLKTDVRAYAATRLGHRVENPERVLRATEKFAQDWVKDVRSVESRLGRRKARF